MKLAKMSIVAALLLGANAYAIDNVKVSGDAKLFYGTQDESVKEGVNTPDIFDKDASYGDVALDLGLTADLSEGVSAGVSVTAVTTLGLENNLVSGTWSNAHSATLGTGASFLGEGQPLDLGGASVDDEWWVGEAWIAGTAGKTTAKVGRQALDTPFAFTETWGIDKNTFEAAVLINQDLPDTTLIGAWIGKSNGSADDTAGVINSIGGAAAGYVSEGGKFNTFTKDGAYAAGIINNSFKPLTAQAWYYEMPSLASAYWLQGDIECSLVEGLMIGAQYATVDVEGAGLDKDKAYALMLGYAVKDVVTIKAAYSSVDDKGTIGVMNTATGNRTNNSTAQTKLYTEMWWNYGVVGSVGTDAYSISAEGTAAGVDLFAGYYYAESDANTVAGADVSGNKTEVTEIALTASKSFGPLDTTLALIYDSYDAEGGLTAGDTEDLTSLQVYLTYNF